MSTISTTRLATMLSCKIPIVCAPMAGVGGGLLAAAVSCAGGFGYIGCGLYSVEWLSEQISLADRVLSEQSRERIPIGVGFMGWRLEEQALETATDFLQLAVDKVASIWLAFGDTLEKWVCLIRKLDSSRQCSVAIMIGCVEEVESMLRWSCQPDILVVQGNEAGGHGLEKSLSLMSLLVDVKKLLAARHSTVVVVAAGGIATGEQAAAALLMGADGVACGTAFIPATESLYPLSQKELVVKSSGSQTVKTRLFDTMRQPQGWPCAVDGRALVNQTVTDSLAGVPLLELRTRYVAAAKEGNIDRVVTWAGSSVGQVNAIVHAGIVVKGMAESMVTSLQRCRTLLE